MTTHGAGAVPPPASALTVEQLPIAALHPDPGNPAASRRTSWWP